MILVGAAAVAQFGQNSRLTDGLTEMYARAADEYMVEFDAELKTELKSLEQLKQFSNYQKVDLIEYSIKPTVRYLFGPMTQRSIGGEQKGNLIDVNWDAASMREGFVFVPYTYHGQWLINNQAESNDQLEIPLPLNTKVIKSANWKNCTDTAHADAESYWYYWDPARPGCDQREGVHYQIIRPQLSKKTVQTVRTYPEYANMTKDGVMSMTFGFGYIEDPPNPQPMTDSDYGMGQLRSFISMVRKEVARNNAKESAILEKEYLGARQPSRVIGTRFEFEKNGVKVKINIVASGSIDQMELFTQSFAHDRDDFFGWFGHSRVGNGFDAFQVQRMLRNNSDYYSISPNYQLIYWAGCNSYSYYTKPFFDFKANLQNNDPSGTKALDIISNGLPSYFSLNASNAYVLVRALTNFDRPVSYQEIVNRLEIQSNQMGIYVLVNVLGDEDNSN